MNTLQQKIESLLFYKNEPVSFTWLAKFLGISRDELNSSLELMKPFYVDRGLTLVFTETDISLMTSAASSEMLATLSKKEDSKELSKQALETLSIILYKGFITKAELDYVRGVNSVFILRNLLIRGLIEKKNNPKDKRSPLYTVTSDTLSFLGIQSKDQLPGFEKYMQKMQELHIRYEEELKEDNQAEE